MILPSPELILAIGSVLVSLWSAVTIAATRAQAADGTRRVEEALAGYREQLKSETEKAMREAEPAEVHVPAPDPLRDPGRLHRSSRARALRMLRTGVTAESAAAALEMPKKEVVLLSRVATLISR